MDVDILIYKNEVDILCRSLPFAVVLKLQNSKRKIYSLTTTHIIISRVLPETHKTFVKFLHSLPGHGLWNGRSLV
jgi:hypothetical protein